ncbi:unnamed protein product [Clonostachys rosea]|uniref:DNA topoisomerase 2 n=1 Tax=Bionectria ochroleuca TaxID=29856 RepID=A0ABY6UBH6_BIOOC|nr:unnamed protein product [Clonostachys rosea]
MDPDSSIEVDSDSSVLEEDLSKTVTKKVTYVKETVPGLEQFLNRPHAYIGSTARTSQWMWVFNKEARGMEYRKISYVPGICKLFDDILMNAVEIKKATEKLSYIKVMIDKAKGEICVENDGQGIPVEMHTEETYLPEIIIGHLLSDSALDGDQQGTYPVINTWRLKVCNAFSREFTVEIHDQKNGKQYKQRWVENMVKSRRPEITNGTTSDMTRVTFQPDFSRLHMPNGIDDDLECLLYRRAYDIVGTVPGIEVFLNNEHIDLDFMTYCKMYADSIASKRSAREGSPSSWNIILEDRKCLGGWEIAVAPSDGSFQQVSFVNSFATTNGGTHVNHIADQITTHLFNNLPTDEKTYVSDQSFIKNQLFIFINCWIQNPTFDSLERAELTTKIRHLGSECILSEAFLKKIAASEILKNAVEVGKTEAMKEKCTSAETTRSHVGNSKLVDAHFAGTERSHECTLILADGDSANGLAMYGRALLDQDRLGILPLPYHLPNVRNIFKRLIYENEEVQALKEALGLERKKSYSSTKGLRYGHIWLCSDRDEEGSLFKGLIINFFLVEFPSLLQIPNFFHEFITPAVIAWQGRNLTRPRKRESFFSLPQFEEWKAAHASEMSLWNHKYLKGLGASSCEDATYYFTDLDKHLKTFEVMRPDEAKLVELVFSKKKADMRKEWLGNYTPGGYVDRTKKSISFGNFISNELILSSIDTTIRSIPCVLDGLTPGQRKVLFAVFKKNLTAEQRVIELAGYVSEQTGYDESETSLHETIIGLAHTFVGSNNVNCLEPYGNSGSRLAGGSDAASPRYLSTRLSSWTRKIFSALDDPSLKMCERLGKETEPEVYAPVIPMILVNGANGIGTGWSTSIPNYNPAEIVQNLKRRMGRLGDADGEEAEFKPMEPWYRYWKGVVKLAGPNRFETNGTLQWDGGSKVVITELPIHVWTDDFRAHLEELISGSNGTPIVKEYRELGDHKTVHFEIQLHEAIAEDLSQQDLQELFKLNKQVKTPNLVAFNRAGQIHKYQTVEEILEEYYTFRLDMYTKRKRYFLSQHEMDYKKLENQARFISEIIRGELLGKTRNKQAMIDQLRQRNYDSILRCRGESDSGMIGYSLETSRQQDRNEIASNFNYLLNMPIWSLSQERLNELDEAIKEKKAEHDALQALSEKDMWCQDLDDFLVEWDMQSMEDSEVGWHPKRIDN